MGIAKTKIFVEAIPLVEERPSGVGHAVLGLVTALATDPEITKKYEVVLVAPKRALHKLDRWSQLKHCQRLGLPMRMRILNGLMKFHLLPPMDLLLGKGVYLFGNFKNWPVTNKSTSFTYIHDICFALYPSFVSPKNQKMLAKNVPKFMKQSDYVITVSESSKQEIIDFYRVSADKILVLYNGVDTTLYRQYSAEEVDLVKARYGISKEYFLFIGNIEPRKNLAQLVAAFRLLPKDRALVLVGGSGWLNEEILAAVDQAKKDGYDIIKPQKYVPDEDVAVLLCGATALVHPALHEGFGMPPAEALATGTPVVAADIPSLREVVGDAGIYCDPQDTRSIADAMQQAVSLTKKAKTSITQKGIMRAKQFSWQQSGRKLFDFLQEKQ